MCVLACICLHLFVRVCLSVCLSVCTRAGVSVCVCVCRSVDLCMSVGLYIFVCACASVCLCGYVFVYLCGSICLSLCAYARVSACVGLSVSVRLSVCLSFHMWACVFVCVCVCGVCVCVCNNSLTASNMDVCTCQRSMPKVYNACEERERGGRVYINLSFFSFRPFIIVQLNRVDRHLTFSYLAISNLSYTTKQNRFGLKAVHLRKWIKTKRMNRSSIISPHLGLWK